MRIVYRSTAITLAALSLSGRALAAPVETVLHSFAGVGDGGAPVAGLIADAQGALYGTTSGGGTGSNGKAFKADAGDGPDRLDTSARNQAAATASAP
ncbi:MAG: hypothetical protein WA624_00665 [Methylocella sp.]